MYMNNTPVLVASAGTTAAAGTTVTSARPAPGTGSAVASAAQTLPFTGINVFFWTLTAITLILMGAAMIRIGRTVLTSESVA